MTNGRSNQAVRSHRVKSGNRDDCQDGANRAAIRISNHMTKTARMTQIESLLELDPSDSFLRYGLAMEYVSVGDNATAAKLLQELVDSEQANPYVPAFLMGGQAYQRAGQDEKAIAILKRGIAAATKAGNDHARGEMEGLLATIE